MGVYLLVFGVVLHSPFADGGHYPLYLLSGLAVWIFFAASLQSATRSMLDNANLIRKTRFPRQLVPFSVVGAHLVTFAVMLVLLLVVNFIALPRVRATVWLAIPLAALFVGLVAGLALTAASLNVALPRHRAHRRGVARALVLPHADALSARPACGARERITPSWC